MKIRIQEDHPGELAEKAEDAVRVIEHLSGRSLLKAAPEPDEQIKQTAAQFEYPSIKQAVDRARTRHVDAVKRHMDKKIAKVLGV